MDEGAGAGLVAVAIIMAFFGGCEASDRADRKPEHFERISVVCQKNGGLKSADQVTATCVDGARFTIWPKD